MKKICFILLCLTGVIAACEKKSLDNNDYLIFGYFFGECLGEHCVDIFKLTNENLFEDTKDQYPGVDENNFNFVKLDDATFQEVTDLIDYFPDELMNEGESTFGCPDCIDQGGIFIKCKQGDNTKAFRIDNANSQIPEYLHPFMDKVKEKIILINQ